MSDPNRRRSRGVASAKLPRRCCHIPMGIFKPAFQYSSASLCIVLTGPGSLHSVTARVRRCVRNVILSSSTQDSALFDVARNHTDERRQIWPWANSTNVRDCHSHEIHAVLVGLVAVATYLDGKYQLTSEAANLCKAWRSAAIYELDVIERRVSPWYILQQRRDHQPSDLGVWTRGKC